MEGNRLLKKVDIKVPVTAQPMPSMYARTVSVGPSASSTGLATARTPGYGDDHFIKTASMRRSRS